MRANGVNLFNMKAIVLAAGYATRLYPLTINKAKPLLPIGGRPILDYIIEGIAEIPEVDTVYIVTNTKFYTDFINWRRSLHSNKEIVIIDDGTTDDADKLGAIGDIGLVISKMSIKDDLLVLAGDNLFGFKLKKFTEFYKQSGLSIAVYKYPHKEELPNYGIVELDNSGDVASFQEKPQFPKTNLVAVCLYAIPVSKLGLVHQYLSAGNNKDAPGYYLQWLVKKEKISAFVFHEPWHDIGAPEEYERVKEEYKNL